MRISSILFIVLTAVGLVSCSGGSHQDLVEYMQEVRQKPARPIEPIPTFSEYHSFTYSAAGIRSPFEAPVGIDFIEGIAQGQIDGPAVQPDPTRIKEYLESFSISSIQMVGTISKGNELWALVDDGTGNIHRVKEGNYMGRSHGRIIAVDNIQISMVEIVPNGLDGWVERPKVLKLVESSK